MFKSERKEEAKTFNKIDNQAFANYHENRFLSSEVRVGVWCEDVMNQVLKLLQLHPKATQQPPQVAAVWLWWLKTHVGG